jgi:hypothetical protein
MATTKSPTTDVHALEIFLDEAVECCEEMIALRKKLKRLKPGSEAYLDLLPKVAVSVTAVKVKSDTLLYEIDAIEDTLPGEDD